ncbi:hard-surface inducible [Fusarium beomiforme]|uniref:Hard-surface inducible n=1 Tax=Fusarium beomiforme TaxID=44412 RepID=A0A9P5DTM7_9HYPO|nr:hard-surface inducible [Fusarium beomiforme]
MSAVVSANQPQYLFNCNIRSEEGTFVDLAGGGGQFPAVIAYDDQTYVHNPNQIWSIFLIDGSNNKVIIKNIHSDETLCADGMRKDRDVNCRRLDYWDSHGHWFVEGGDITSLDEFTPIRLRNGYVQSCFLDLAGGNSRNGTPFMCWEGHGGPNQHFKLWKR